MGDDIPNDVEGILKCKVLPPKQLFHPVLACRIRQKLIFPLCYTCAQEGEQTFCSHSDEERSLVGTWVTVELEKALAMGYIILERYEAWHFSNTTQYNPITKEGGLWASFIDTFLKLKQEASGYPSDCVTNAQKDAYVQDYFNHEGIALEASNIAYNKSIREIAKLMLNRYILYEIFMKYS